MQGPPGGGGKLREGRWVGGHASLTVRSEIGGLGLNGGDLKGGDNWGPRLAGLVLLT